MAELIERLRTLEQRNRSKGRLVEARAFKAAAAELELTAQRARRRVFGVQKREAPVAEMYCGNCWHYGIRWMGPLMAPTHTECPHCGGVNCQIDPAETDNEGDS